MTYQTKITTLDNGSYLVKGPVLLVDAEGNEFRAERATVALCRCGGSMNVLDDFPKQTQGDGEFGVVCPHNYRFGVFGLDL